MQTGTHQPLIIGQKIERIRKMRGINQEGLAQQLGTTRQAISKMEQSDQVEDDKLEQVAKALGVSADTIRNFKDDATVNNIQYNYEGSNKEAHDIFVINNFCTLNPLEDYNKLLEENKKLYEQLLQSEREKFALLQSMLPKHGKD